MSWWKVITEESSLSHYLMAARKQRRRETESTVAGFYLLFCFLWVPSLLDSTAHIQGTCSPLAPTVPVLHGNALTDTPRNVLY
jgi:hypothetical protein